jgi:predicted DNA-binding transcriptional regulator AlpA
MRILPEKEVCERLNIRRTKFWQLRRAGKFPQPVDGGYPDIWVDQYIDRLIREAETKPRQGEAA